MDEVCATDDAASVAGSVSSAPSRSGAAAASEAVGERDATQHLVPVGRAARQACGDVGGGDGGVAHICRRCRTRTPRCESEKERKRILM